MLTLQIVIIFIYENTSQRVIHNLFATHIRVEGVLIADITQHSEG